MKFKKKASIFFLLFPFIVLSQNLENIGKSSLFKLTGGVGVNTVFYEGNSNRAPFTYFLSGNVNVNVSGVYNIPLSFSYSNSKFQTNNPFSFNRFSLHPSYKWVTAHIGDVNMTFSPYTLSGHQFTGLGVDLSPKEKFKVSLMYGRLLKEREYNVDNFNGEANYRRVGYGVKASYKFDKFTLGGIFFKASDVVESLKERIPVEKEIQPKDNTVISVDGEFSFIKDLKIRGEVAVSALTEDIRAGGGNNGFMSFLMKTNVTTQYYKAYNINFLYQVGKGNIGIRYEYIDPDYKTLGGYFFNNDLENITINGSQRIFKDKVGVAINVGLQRDDLKGAKASQLKRLVSSVNVSYDASKKMNMTLSYSNFQSYTNIKNQFDYINGISQVEQELDKANITQISQNANLNVNYILKESDVRRENINVGLTFQDAANKVGDTQRSIDQSTLYNGNLAYTVGYPQKDLTLSGALNASYNVLDDSNSIIMGPTISASKGFLDKKLKVNSSLGYNQSRINGENQGEITNFRVSSRYVYKKRHNFNLNGMVQFRNSLNTSRKDFTVTFGYTYRFGIFDSKDLKFSKKPNPVKSKIKIVRRTKTKTKNDDIKFIFRDSLYEGTIPQIDYKIASLLHSSLFEKIPQKRKNKLDERRIEIAKETNKKAYKIKSIQFLKELYDSEDVLNQYYTMLFETVNELQADAERLDYSMEMEYIKNRKEAIKHPLWNKSEEDKKEYAENLQAEFKKVEEKLQKSLKKLLTHRWIVSETKKYSTIDEIKNDTQVLNKFYEENGSVIFEKIENEKNKQKIKLYLLEHIIEFLAHESENYIDNKQYQLKYIYKN
ncbi:hypothetical protein ACQY1Q_10090 [Tenacibaculum sp. TC6]|uniref:hypothetical protein n=1 Tax=Tenacibaculum sp. TC6 TaxID=3423223 RepID=UPI003D36C8EA